MFVERGSVLTHDSHDYLGTHLGIHTIREMRKKEKIERVKRKREKRQKNAFYAYTCRYKHLHLSSHPVSSRRDEHYKIPVNPNSGFHIFHAASFSSRHYPLSP